MKFYECSTCHNIFYVVDDSGVIPVCCNQPMNHLCCSNTMLNEHEISYTTETMNDIQKVCVHIGKDKPHPMSNEHYIMWVVIKTDKGAKFHMFSKESEHSCATFYLSSDEKIRSIALYCNIHGLYEKFM